MAGTRELIIETTARLLSERGYHATGLSDIVEQSGAPKGSLYYYFPGGKDELAAQAIERIGRAAADQARTVLATAEEPSDAILALVGSLADGVAASGYTTGAALAVVALETAGTSKSLQAACDSAYALWQAAVAEKLVQGGFSEARAAEVALVIVSAIDGGVILSRAHQSIEPLQHVAAALVLLLKHTPIYASSEQGGQS